VLRTTDVGSELGGSRLGLWRPACTLVGCVGFAPPGRDSSAQCGFRGLSLEPVSSTKGRADPLAFHAFQEDNVTAPLPHASA